MRWAVLLFAAATAVQAAPPTSITLSNIDLSIPFSTRSPWRFTAVQDPPIDNPLEANEDQVAGPIRLCLKKTPEGPCDPQLRTTLNLAATPDDPYAQPHTLKTARLVHPQAAGGKPLLLVQTASLPSGDGDQALLTQLLAYRPGLDRFERIYERLTGKNNNQEVRYIDTGPLAGAVISAEPTADAPFAFWIAVNTLDPGHPYHQVLRYRSATRYNDGNPLTVIDSELPNIEQHLGLWRPGSPLPLPATPCPKPHLIRMELWCN